MPTSPAPDGAGSTATLQLAALWAEGDLALALARGARLLAGLTGSAVSALFLISDEGVGVEAWHPEPLEMERRLRYQRAALQGPDPDPRDCAGPGVSVLRVSIPTNSSTPERPAAALAWVRDSGVAGTTAAAALEIVAWKVAREREAAHLRARQEQYERWFRTLDAQLRILDRERQKFAAVANQTDTFAFVTDDSRTVRWLNKAMSAVVGCDSDGDWQGRSCSLLCTKVGLKSAEAPCDRCPVMRAFITNASVHSEISDAPGGRELYLTALPIKGPDGLPLEVLAQVQDLTHLEVVRRAKERLETVVSGAPIVLFAVDKEGIITVSEGKGLEALGRSPGQTVGLSIFELYREAPAALDAIRRVLAGETVTEELQIGDLFFESSCGPVRGEDGSIQGAIGVATNVTQRRRAELALQESEEKLQHAQRLEAVGSLAGGVAHDFNNLLTVMFGHLKFLRERTGDSPALRAEVESIQQAAHRAATLTRQLLAFSRKQVLQLRVVDLHEIVREMEPMLRRLLGEDVELEIQAGARHPWIRADRGQMEQIVINLAANARDAMPHGGRLTLATMDLFERTSGLHPSSEYVRHEVARRIEANESVQGPHVALLVNDTGKGMDAATQARAFEPFFTTKPVGEGTGLGLSTVYGIVKQSGGEVLLTSEPGEGTTFTLCFPATDAPSESESPRREVARTEGGAETILLVEDEVMVRDLFRDILVEAGYRVLEAPSGVDALDLIARHPEPIHLMVTDVIMPGMGGGELVRRMAEVRPEVKVLYVSGYNDDVLVRRGVIDSGVSFLQKPCMPEELTRLVRSILG
jgi:two-component system cell cycle sensor histidine kinase/response regulator CckA